VSIFKRFGAWTSPNGSVASFDRVVLSGSEGKRELTRSEFEALPLDKRVQIILQEKPRFYRGDQEVSPREALHRD
jgi:hypothetical protein